MRRLFYIAFGAAAGVLVVRRVSAAANKWTPDGLAAQAGGAGERLAAWWGEVQAYSAQREAELREALGLEASGSEDGDQQ